MDMAQLAALAWLLKPQTVAAQLQQEPEPGPLPPSQWWGDVVKYPTVLIFGQFGSGKTTLARQVVEARLALGHQVIVCDPHMAAGAWSGCDRVGAGMDYQGVDDALTRFAQEVESRYKTLAVNASADFTPITYVCDEFTHWADRTKHAADFFAASMADTRKVKMFALFISHGRTLSCLGGKAGLAKTRDDSLLEVQLFAKPDPNAPTGVSPTGLGELKRPGQQPVAVAIPAPGTSATPAIAPASLTAPSTESPADFLSRCFDQTITVDHETIAREPAIPTAEQVELIDAIVAIARRHDRPITASDCIRGSRPLKALGADAIRSLFVIAQAMGRGSYADGKFTALG